MKKTTQPNAFSKLVCAVIGHNYVETKKVTSHVREYTCKCCKKQLTINGNGKLVELTPKFQEINSVLERIHERRMIRLQEKTMVSSIY